MTEIVLKQLEAEETTKSGIVLPGQAKEKPQEAEVIAVGPGGVVDGKEVVMQVKVGDKVIYSKYAGTDVKLEGEEYIIVKQNDILAIVEVIPSTNINRRMQLKWQRKLNMEQKQEQHLEAGVNQLADTVKSNIRTKRKKRST